MWILSDNRNTQITSTPEVQCDISKNIFVLTIGTEEDTVGVFSGQTFWLQA